MFLDELHKVFQFMDKDSKGFLPVDSVLAMYEDIVQSKFNGVNIERNRKIDL